MNQIFKIVFNVARGTMMIVNETTSSVQTGKKAAVTVAVISALAATNVAVAASIYGAEQVTGGSHQFDSFDTVKVVSQDINNNISGGPLIKGLNDPTKLVVGSTNIEIRNSNLSGSQLVVGTSYIEGYNPGKDDPPATTSRNNWNPIVDYSSSTVTMSNVSASNVTVIGGGRIYNAGCADLEVTNTKIYIDELDKNGKETIVGNVVGGSFVGGSKTKSSVVKSGNTYVYVGDGVEVTSNVIGGHWHNLYGNDASVEKVNIELVGASVGGSVIGGNYFQANNTNASSTTFDSIVGEVNVTVTNSEVGNVILGDYLYNNPKQLKGMTSTFGIETEPSRGLLKMSNSIVSGNVVGGSFVTGKNTGNVITDEFDVLNMVITDSTVNGAIVSSNLITWGNNSTQPLRKTVDISLTNVEAQSLEVLDASGTLKLIAERGKRISIDKMSLDSEVIVDVTVSGESNDAAGGDLSQAVFVAEKSGEFKGSGKVVVEAGEFTDALTGKIVEGVFVPDAIQTKNPMMANLLDLYSGSTLSLNRIAMNDVRKRMGDLRASNGTHGVWARYDGGKLSGAAGLENDFTTIQVGIDTIPVADAPRFGVAFAYTTSEADMNRASADVDAYSLAFYGTKMYEHGLFVDVIGRLATADTDVTIDGEKKGAMDNVALSLSGELGWRFDVTDSFYIEPQAELTYTYINADELIMSSGNEYDFDSVDSLMGRIGFAAGFKCPSNFGDVYVRASAVHEFLGDASLSVNNGARIFDKNGEDTWIEFGIGANFNINKYTYVYADIERTEGAKLEEDWRANVGVRYAF